MKRGVVFLTLLLHAMALAFANDTDAVVIDPTESRELIRRAVLSHTPPGSTTDHVRRFIREQLRVEKPALLRDPPASGPANAGSSEKGIKSIQILLGRYITNPLLLTLQIPLPLATDVSVQWAFDRDGKLVDVFVEKVLEGS